MFLVDKRLRTQSLFGFCPLVVVFTCFNVISYVNSYFLQEMNHRKEKLIDPDSKSWIQIQSGS